MSKQDFRKEIDEAGCLLGLDLTNGGTASVYTSVYDCLTQAKRLAATGVIVRINLWPPLGFGNDHMWTWKNSFQEQFQ